MGEMARSRGKGIGVFLSGWEGGIDVAGWARGEGYAVVELADWRAVEGATLRGWDAILVPLSAWLASGQALRAIRREGSEIEPRPAVMVYCPPGSDLGLVNAGEPGDDLTFVMYPMNARHLGFQIKAVMEQQRVISDLRYRLKEREDVLRSISEVFFSVDHEFRYTFFNEKAQMVGGKTEEELLGKDMWEMFPALKGTEFDRQMHQVARDRQILVAEYLGPMTGGWFEMRIYPSAAGISALFVDISARKQAEESLRRAQEQLKEANSSLESAVAERTRQLHEANQRLEELLYSIAHDLRSPLRSMQGFAQALVDDYAAKLDEQARAFGRRMTASAMFMDRMLSDLLELGRISRGEIKLGAVDVAAAWASALAQNEEAIRRTEAEIETGTELGRVEANETLLAQILANLLGNALKFRRAGMRPQVKIWTGPADDGMVPIYVEDKGIGIDERFHDRIFRVFERLNGSEFEGTGIGLAMARKAAERMRGRLDLTSTPGVGTRFRLTLPGRVER
jgi:PAS domain S-box-containing protein